MTTISELAQEQKKPLFHRDAPAMGITFGANEIFVKAGSKPVYGCLDTATRGKQGNVPDLLSQKQRLLLSRYLCV